MAACASAPGEIQIYNTLYKEICPGEKSPVRAGEQGDEQIWDECDSRHSLLHTNQAPVWAPRLPSLPVTAWFYSSADDFLLSSCLCFLLFMLLFPFCTCWAALALKLIRANGSLKCRCCISGVSQYMGPRFLREGQNVSAVLRGWWT